jgi:hypothetical protein
MLSCRSLMLATVLAATSLASQATTVNLAADGQWNAFTVDALSSLSGGVEWIDGNDSNAQGFGSALNYSFTIAAGQQGLLTVVDANFAGDTFQVFNQGVLLGTTSAVPQTSYDTALDLGDDHDAALLSPAFSHRTFALGAGTYSISGALAQSVLLDGQDLNATGGALKLSVSAVPEPGTGILLLSALGVIGLVATRRTSSR